ncbi:MAG TPA: efflux RND transporter permease subunit, partial [Sumerlaeia bacterium]|nr:efflux RND transporter permease subunit [Sumerlaeia bacterium]
PGIRMSVNKQSGTNTVEVSRQVEEELRRVNEDYPQIQIATILNTAEYIERSISNAGSAVVYGGVLAVFVLLFFLRRLSSTAVIAIAIPISIVATFGLMYFAGFTMNVMTLGGLALGVGMLVDNAIVVLENIFRLRENGASAEEAAVGGSEEVAAAVVASTLTTVAVFLPLIFIRGMSGVMFRQLACVVGFALLCSLVVALSLVPMLAARLLRGKSSGNRNGSGRSGGLAQVSARLFSGMENAYRDALRFSLRHRFLVVVGGLLLFAGSLGLVPLIGTELMPQADENEVRVDGEMEIGTRLELTDARFQEIEEIVRRAVPEIRNMDTYIGGGRRSSGPHLGGIRISLAPRSERKRSSEEIAADLRGKLAHIPGMEIRTRAGQGLFLIRMAFGGEERVQVEIRGHDLEVSAALAQRVQQIAESVEGVTDTRISRETGSPEELILIDRQKAADMKLSVSQIARTLQSILSGTRAGEFREAGKEYRILVKMKDAEQMDLREILDMRLSNADGEPVILRNVVRTESDIGATVIERKNQERVVTVSCNVSGRDMGSIIEDIKAGLGSLPVPRGFAIAFAGDYEEQQEAFRELLMSLILALVLVYMVMACQYESLRDPLVVMFSVPLAVIGVAVILFLTDTTFNIQSYIGCIMLGGIVVNNAILLVDHTNLLRRRDGLGLHEAIEEAGRRRLRPILMTALTTILALIPLALGLGEGGEAQAPMARAVIGGLTSSTLITLVFVPVVYSLFESAGASKKQGS